jgi:hypothetical protein
MIFATGFFFFSFFTGFSSLFRNFIENYQIKLTFYSILDAVPKML